MTTQMEVKKITPAQEVRKTLESDEFKQQLKMALPPQTNVDKFIRVAVTAVAQDPTIAANRPSFYNACMKAAADGLVPDGKEAAFVKFGDTATYMPMVAGILKKVRNSGELSTIDAQVVHKNDKFTYRPGIDEVPVFEPNWFGDRGDAIGVYAVARTKDGGAYVEIMNKTQIDAIKNVARTKTVWGGPFAFEMWRKSVIRRLAKRLPSSTDLEQMIERIDEEIEIPKEDPKPVEEAKPTSSRLAKVVEAQTEKPKPEADPKPTMGEPDESPFNDELPI